MPNWCYNRVTLTHENPEMIKRVSDSVEVDNFLREFVSPPEDFNYEDGWYEWNIENWGTKWSVSAEIEESQENSITLVFNSAWSPPLEFYKKLFEDYKFGILAYYHEPGMGFCGKFETNNDEILDEYYDIENDLDWVKDNIPEDIDDEMGISSDLEAMQEWGEDDE